MSHNDGEVPSSILCVAYLQASYFAKDERNSAGRIHTPEVIGSILEWSTSALNFILLFLNTHYFFPRGFIPPCGIFQPSFLANGERKSAGLFHIPEAIDSILVWSPSVLAVFLLFLHQHLLLTEL